MSFIKDPRYDKGRWYRIFVESDGTHYKLHDNPITDTLSGGYLKVKKGFHVVTFEIDYTFTESTTGGLIENRLQVYADGTTALILASVNRFSSAYIYVFGYEE